MGGPRVTENTESFIRRIWESMITDEDATPSAKEVLAAAENSIAKHKIKNIFLPKIRKVQQILAKAQKNKNEIPKEKKVLSESWTMETLNTAGYDLPPDSLKFVLQVWRYSINIDEKFTVRQARWVSRLYSFFIDQDIVELWLASRRYSKEEEYSCYFKDSMYNFELQKDLVMRRWESGTLALTDFHDNSPDGFPLHTIRPLANDGGIAEELIHIFPDLDPDPGDPIFSTKEGKRFNKIVSLIKELPSSTKYFPDLESRMVYLRQLTFISKMSKWRALSPKEIRDIIVDLREWVTDVKHKIDTNSPIIYKFPSRSFTIPGDLKQIPQPVEIYLRAGWETEGER